MRLVGDCRSPGTAKSCPGRTDDRVEEHLAAPIESSETVSARPAIDVEQRRLRRRGGLPVLVVEVDQTRVPAGRFAVSYQVLRDESAGSGPEQPSSGLRRSRTAA
ncbi:hypothetical protein ACFXKG_33585 [Streptomyces sp. NPDC059255]|uniref:hypothetical protein n=1 Tax=Streptomyces sp. NPDC059255 TaxID=3346793 RepID=UPI0036BAA706